MKNRLKIFYGKEVNYYGVEKAVREVLGGKVSGCQKKSGAVVVVAGNFSHDDLKTVQGLPISRRVEAYSV